MQENNKDMFVVKLPLKTEKWQEDILNRRFEYCEEIYNDMNSKMLKTFFYYKNFKEWKEIEECTNKSKKTTLIKNFIKKYNLPFSPFGFNSFVGKFNARYRIYGINAKILQNLAQNLWRSYDKFLFGEGKKIHYKKKNTLNSYTIGKDSKGYFNMMNYDLLKSNISININGGKCSNAKFMTIPFIINKKSEYEMNSFSPSNEIRAIGIQREFIRGKWKYFVLFTIKGEKPSKGRKIGKGTVGIDLGPSSIAVSSNYKVYLGVLASEINNVQFDEKKLRCLQRKMDRSRRQNNPLQYNDNGTIRKYPKGERPEWIKSNNYIKLENEIKELYRKKSAKVKLSHNILSNEILTSGDNFIVENNPIKAWQKGLFGKSVGNRAPGMFIELLKNKVESFGGTFTNIETKNAASQYDFTNGVKTKHELKERNITLSNGNTHLRDTIAAFNIQHFNGGDYDVNNMIKNYDKFCSLEEQEIERHKENRRVNGIKPLKSFGI